MRKLLLIVLLLVFGRQSSMAQQFINGQVLDSLTKEGLPGATIKLKGGNAQTTTDVQGKFRIAASGKAVLEINFIGYRSKEVTVEAGVGVVVELRTNTSELDKVVVMAYSSSIKRKMVAGVTNVDVKQVENLAGYKDLANALQGRVAGVQITNSSGNPALGARVSIRGGGTPLYVIDGIIQDGSMFNRLVPEDIESLSIMKDANATAVYGATAQDGVIVVTTKKGRSGPLRVNYVLDNQFNQPLNLNEKLSSIDKAKLYNEVYNYMGQAKPYSDAVLTTIAAGNDPNFPNTDWQDLLVKKVALSQRHTLTLDGGSEASQYRASFMLYKQGNLTRKAAGDQDPFTYKTYSSDLNLSTNVKKIGLQFSLDLKPYLTDNAAYGANPFSILDRLDPLAKVYNANGTYAPNSQVALFDTRGAFTRTLTYGNDLRVNADWNVAGIDGLKVTFAGNFAFNSGRDKIWTGNVPTYNEDGSAVAATAPTLTLTNTFGYRYEINTGLNYTKTLARVHHLSANLIFNQRETYEESTTAKRINYFSNISQLSAGPTDGQTTAGSAAQAGRLGYVGVINYDYKDKYLLRSTFRYDGTDAYEDGRRWGLFPSVALGYVISEEPFMQKVKDHLRLDLLKLRFSLGQVGATGNRFAYLSVASVNQNGAYIGGALAPSVTPGSLTSQDFTWYTTTSYNAGIDLSFLNSRLTLSADYFYNRTTGYLVNPVNRYNSPLGNVTGTSGTNYVTGLPRIQSDDAFRRAGAEFEIFWKGNLGELSYGVGANLSFYDQLWEKYAQGDDAVTVLNPLTRTTYRTLGQGIAIYEAKGLYRNSYDLLHSPLQNAGNALAAGDVSFVDVNGDGRIDVDDLRYSNKPTGAIMQYGVPFNLGYKGFFFDGLIQGTGPQYAMLNQQIQGTGLNRIYYSYQAENVYLPSNPNATNPRADNDFGAWNGEFNRAGSTLWLVNKTYVRLKNVNIGYDLKRLFRNARLFSSARLSLAGTNLITISPAKRFFDPEMSDNGGVGLSGGQTLAYPVTRTYSLLLNVKF